MYKEARRIYAKHNRNADNQYNMLDVSGMNKRQKHQATPLF